MSPLSLECPTPKKFWGGQISERAKTWGTITSDSWILNSVRGVAIPFEEWPLQTKEPKPYKLAGEERDFIDEELVDMLSKGIVERAVDLEGQVVSNIFLRPKKDGGFRMILDLTWLNEHVEYEHFKMTSIRTAVDMMRPACWLGSIDLKNAYYSVLIRLQDRKFLRFRWQGQLFQFRVLPNGLACAPRIFTKLLAPIFAELRERGHECFPYIDDTFVVADSFEKCRDTLGELKSQLEKLGFVIHEQKSVVEPTRQLVFLGYILDSETMRIALTSDKEEKLKRAAFDLLRKVQVTIREVAGLVGLMVAFSQAFNYGAVHLKELEMDKIQALNKACGDFDSKMVPSLEGMEDVHWWLQNVENSGRDIRQGDPDIVIFTDASNDGWGAHVGETTAGGRWSEIEGRDHINVLELRAILLGLQSLCIVQDVHIRIMTDNTTALAYVKHQGGVKSQECHRIAKQIWIWAENRRIWLSAAHIPGVDNVLADYKSRNFEDNLEWELNEKLFNRIVDTFGQPKIDLFASRLNMKVERFVSWKPDPEALAIDAFTLNWSKSFFYAFPPFSCVGRVVEKIVDERAEGILVVPHWPTRPWWGRLVALGLRKLMFRSRKNNLKPVGQPDNVHWLSKSPLVAFLFSTKV